jgi:hypothetical protein
MGFVREPDGVDFYVINRPLTEKERKETNEWIEKDKKKTKAKNRKYPIRKNRKAVM